MTTRAAIDDFLGQEALALVGASRSGKKFGNGALSALKERGYRVFPVHPSAQEIGGEKCYRSLGELPEKVDGIVVVVPPAQTELVVRDAYAAGIRRVWMQQGAESEAAIGFCKKHDMSAIHGQCIMMFLDHPELPHRLHGLLRRLFGRFPK